MEHCQRLWTWRQHQRGVREAAGACSVLGAVHGCHRGCRQRGHEARRDHQGARDIAEGGVGVQEHQAAQHARRHGRAVDAAAFDSGGATRRQRSGGGGVKTAATPLARLHHAQVDASRSLHVPPAASHNAQHDLCSRCVALHRQGHTQVVGRRRMHVIAQHLGRELLGQAFWVWHASVGGCLHLHAQAPRVR